MPGLPVHHQLPEFTQTHVHWVSDAIQLSHPLSSPSLSAFNLSQHQGLFKWVSSSHQMAIILEFQLQHRSFQWIFMTDLLYNGLVGSPCSPRESQESSTTPQFKRPILQCSAFFIVQLSHPYMTTGQSIALTRRNLVDKAKSLLFIYLFIIIFFISWRLITLQYCSGFCHTLKWISHGFTCIPHPDPLSHLPLHPIPLGLPGAPGPSTCLMHPTWAGDLFHPR